MTLIVACKYLKYSTVFFHPALAFASQIAEARLVSLAERPRSATGTEDQKEIPRTGVYKLVASWQWDLDFFNG